MTVCSCSGSALQPVMTSEEEDEQEEEAPATLMLIVLNEDAIRGFHEQVLAFMHASCACIKQDQYIAVMQVRHSTQFTC